MLIAKLPQPLFAVIGAFVALLLSPLSQAATATAAPEDFAARQAHTQETFKKQIIPFIKAYCFNCHGDRRMKGGVTFAPSLKAPGSSAARKKWREAVGNVKAHDMPPEDYEKQPTDEERQVFLDWVDNVKYLSPRDPGPYVMRRLTKVEYGNTLHDLFGVDPSIAQELPDEVFGEGYLNNLSPLQSEQYLGIANEVLDRILAPPGKPATEVQQRLFGETPAAGASLRTAASIVARRLTRQTFRRPASHEEIEVLLRVFDLAQVNQLSYPESLRLMLKAILVSPQFLFITPAKAPEPGQTIVPLDDYQLAARLSYLLWATMPDAELAALADAGRLQEPAVLRAQTKRLLADPRSRALFDGFGTQWLGLNEFAHKTFDPAKFPQIIPAMRTAMYDEVRLFFNSIVAENRPVINFINGDYTYLNGTLAQLYKLEGAVAGPEMRRIKLPDANRGGILGMPAILATTSFPNRTSPVRRGVWVLEQVLGEVVPPAPPDVPALEKQKKEQVENLTLRQRTELHRTNAACANCHKILDPIGFGLENFDAVGQWRAQDDTGGPIDAAGELPGAKRFSTPRELKAILAERKADVARNLTQRLLAYALCRPLEGYDEIVVDQLMAGLAADDFRMQDLISAVVSSYPFVNQRLQEPAALAAHGQ